MSEPTKDKDGTTLLGYPNPKDFLPQDYGEPWIASFPAGAEARVWYADGDRCAIIEENLGLGVNDQDVARRIVACVNALRGVSDPEAFVKAADDLRDWLTSAVAPASLLHKFDDARRKP